AIAMWKGNQNWQTGTNLLISFDRAKNRENPIWDEYPTLRDALLPACNVGLSVNTRQQIVFDVFVALYNLLPIYEQAELGNLLTGELSSKPNGQAISEDERNAIRNEIKTKAVSQIEKDVQEHLNMHAVGETKSGIPKAQIESVANLPKGDHVEDHPNFKGF